jgi:magnesium-protoporphyrin IX monomethyl ester (oxidative) cyclase
MIKVLLINPPQTYYNESADFGTYFPLGLMYVAAMIRDICHVEIFDCLTSDFETRKGNSITYGANPEIIKKVINEKKPDVVGISVPFTAQYINAELVAKITKEVNPKIVTVFGGPDPSVRFKTILENNYCDYCIIGEGEQTFYEFIKNVSFPSSYENIKGLAYKRNGIIQYEPRPFNTNLDELPFPAFDLVDVKLYLQNKYLYRNRSAISKNSISIITSRGCPYNCVFCSIKLHMGKKYRAHSPQYVMKLLRLCIDKYGITNFHFEDDNLSFDKQRFETILDCIIKENLKIQWDTPNGLRADSLNYKILEKMKQSGCKQINLAIESGNQRVLDNVIKKKTKLEYMINIVKYCNMLKIPALAFYVIGFPGETINEMKDTTNLALKLYRYYGLYPALMMATPLYGTELYEICIRDNLIKGNPTVEELSTATQLKGNPMISTSEFSQKDIRQIINEYTDNLSRERSRSQLKHPTGYLISLRTSVRARELNKWLKDVLSSFLLI